MFLTSDLFLIDLDLCQVGWHAYFYDLYRLCDLAYDRAFIDYSSTVIVLWCVAGGLPIGVFPYSAICIVLFCTL